MESTWKIPHGIHVEIPYGMVESTWNPPHSMWNIGGRKSPKLVRSQPKHIPCGIGGQGKDLSSSLKRRLVCVLELSCEALCSHFGSVQVHAFCLCSETIKTLA
jgi:hypothetical protein